MLRSLAAVTVLVPDYDDGLAFFSGVLGFAVLEDTQLSPAKRWIVVAPSQDSGAALVLAVPSDEGQRTRVGDQVGGRVGFFLYSDNFWGITRICSSAGSISWKSRVASPMAS
jgi:catechol 2,3-dioxygenase-like lactoylglutathione lyase family enzyme